MTFDKDIVGCVNFAVTVDVGAFDLIVAEQFVADDVTFYKNIVSRVYLVVAVDVADPVRIFDGGFEFDRIRSEGEFAVFNVDAVDGNFIADLEAVANEGAVDVSDAAVAMNREKDLIGGER